MNFKFKKLMSSQVIIRLIEDELSRDRYVKTVSLFLEKNALNDEHTHSYFARVLDVCENRHGINKGDIVYMNHTYAREIYKDDDGVPFMVCSLPKCIAKIHDFDINKVFSQ